MSAEKYIENLKAIRDSLLIFLDNESNLEENYQNFNNLLIDQKVFENAFEIKSLLQLILNISNNHYRSATFFDKIDQVIIYVGKLNFLSFLFKFIFINNEYFLF